MTRRGRKRKGRRRRALPYSKGDLNNIIDDVLHPFAENETIMVLIDGLLHAIVEGKPSKSLVKFIKFNLPTIIAQLTKWREPIEGSSQIASSILTRSPCPESLNTLEYSAR